MMGEGLLMLEGQFALQQSAIDIPQSSILNRLPLLPAESFIPPRQRLQLSPAIHINDVLIRPHAVA
jgi:hypothetical protein